MQFPVNLAPTRHGKRQAFRRNSHMLYYFCNEMLAKFMLQVRQIMAWNTTDCALFSEALFRRPCWPYLNEKSVKDKQICH